MLFEPFSLLAETHHSLALALKLDCKGHLWQPEGMLRFVSHLSHCFAEGKLDVTDEGRYVCRPLALGLESKIEASHNIECLQGAKWPFEAACPHLF